MINLYSFKVQHHKILITKNKQGNFEVNKSDRCHLNQVIRVSSVMTQIKIHHLCDILAKDASFECNHEKVYNPKFKNIPQNN